MADKENLFPLQIKWVAVPLDAILNLNDAQKWCRENHERSEIVRNKMHTLAIDDFLDVREVKTALENHA